MVDKKAGGQIVKSWREVIVDADWDGTTSTFSIDGDRPIVGLAINLSDAATLTFEVLDEAGTAYTVLNDAGAELSIDATTNLDTYRFYSEFGPARNITITADVSQTNATVTALLAS